MNPPSVRIGVVAGSGIDLLPLLDTELARRPFIEIPGLAAGAVPGHSLAFVLGRCGGASLAIQCGRLHVYEGFGYASVVAPVDVMRSWGVETIVFTNAAGGLEAGMRPGDLMAVTGVKPWRLCRRAALPDPILPGFLVPGCEYSGSYVWVHGPCYETRAEIRAMQRLGGAAVGMSLAPELLHCRALGLNAAGISCITNNCCAPGKLTHTEVVETARAASEKICAVLRAWVTGQ